MAQAECITTAIRALMSRGQPPKPTSPVRAAHTDLVAALAGKIPYPIPADVDSDDLEARADHVEGLFAALQVYFDALIGDTAENVPGGLPGRRYLGTLFQDLVADAVGAIRNAAEEMREHETWRAS